MRFFMRAAGMLSVILVSLLSAGTAMAEETGLQIASLDSCACLDKNGDTVTDSALVKAPTAAELDVEIAAQRKLHASLALFKATPAAICSGSGAAVDGSLSSMAESVRLGDELLAQHKKAFFERVNYPLSEVKSFMATLPLYQELEKTRLSNPYAPARAMPEIKLVSPCELSRRADGKADQNTGHYGYHEDKSNTIYINACNDFHQAVFTLVHEEQHAFSFNSQRKKLRDDFADDTARVWTALARGADGMLAYQGNIREGEELPAYVIEMRADREMRSRYDMKAYPNPSTRICGNTADFNDWLQSDMRPNENYSVPRTYSDAEVKAFKKAAGCNLTGN